MIFLISGKWLLAFIIANMLLALGALAVGFYLYQSSGRYLQRDMLFVVPLRADGQDLLTDDVRQIPGIFLESRGSIPVSRGDIRSVSEIIFCNAGYFSLHFMNFIEGGPWHDLEDDRNIIVLNEALAWYLFGGNDITGLTVELTDGPYSVIGVVRLGGARHMAWTPVSDRSLPVSAMYFRPYPYNPLNARTEAVRLLDEHYIFDFAIVDINRFVESIKVRYRILLYSMWLWIVLLMLQTGIKGEKKWLLVAAIPIAGAVFFGIYDILTWLPNIANPDISLTGTLSNIGELPPDSLFPYGVYRLSFVNRIANYVWVAGTAGFLNLVFILHWQSLLPCDIMAAEED